MRLYVSILAVASMSISACDKKAEQPKPEPAKTDEAKKDEAAKPEEAKKDEAKPEEAKKDEAKPEEAKKDEPAPAPAADRTEGVQKGIEAWAAGKFDEVFANYTDDAVQYNVGSPTAGEVKGKAAIIDREKAVQAGMSDIKMKASRIIETGDIQIVQAVMTANVKTKGADGAEVVKAVAAPLAMVMQYNAEGKVAAQWVFMDEMNVLQQVGAIPGLAEGFVAAVLPETTEVIKGETNPAHAELYKAFGAKMTPDTIEAAVTEHFAEDYTMVDFRTGKTIDKAGSAATLKGWMAMFTDATMTTDKEFSVGEYYVTITTNTSTYKDGIPGATAGAKVTTTELAVSRIVDGKFKSWAGYMNGLQMASQLGLTAGAAEKPAEVVAAGEALGVAECDLYLTKMNECLSKLAPEAKGAIEQGMKTNAEAWKKQVAEGGDAVKAQLATSCKTILETSKIVMGSMCPDVKWE